MTAIAPNVLPNASLDETLASPTAGVARAVYGLVDDQYAVVAHTPNLTRDSARDLCRAVSIGDPTVPVDDALSFLQVPGWGYVCTRYATDRDARGRLAIVSDSVSVDQATFHALRGDPFRCMPRRGDLPNGPRELSVPRFTPSTPDAEAARLAEARRTVDEPRELRPLLAALLAGERVLQLSPNGPLAPAVLQCIVLLLPPSLRGLATFQTIATRAPLHAPRLTGADRRYAELGAVSWTRELPRETVGDPRADAAADALLALSPSALITAHALYEELFPIGDAPLLGAMERVARYGTLADALTTADAAAALGTFAIDAPIEPREIACTADRLLAGIDAATLASAFVRRLDERSVRGYRAGTVFVNELLRREIDATSNVIAHTTLDALLRAADGARWTSDDAARALRTALAVAAARRGDGDRLVQLAEADATWPSDGPPARGASPAVRATTALVAALARAGDAPAACIGALGALAPSLSTSARRDAAALALVVAGRALAANATQPEPVQSVTGALVELWVIVPAADERDEAVRELLVPSASSRGGSDAEQRAGTAIKRLIAAGTSAGALGGWIGAAMLRTLADDRNATALVAAIDAAGRTDALGTSLGALLLAAAPAGPPLRDGWPALIERVDATARRELLVRTLARVTNGVVALDELAATCGALADLGFQLDDAAAAIVAPPLGRWAATLPPTRGAAARVGMALDLLGELADVSTARALVASVMSAAPEPLRALVQLRRLAVAAAEVDATREPAAWAALRTSLRAHLAEPDATLLAGQRAALCDLLDVRGASSSSALARFWPGRGRSPDGKAEGSR